MNIPKLTEIEKQMEKLVIRDGGYEFHFSKGELFQCYPY